MTSKTYNDGSQDTYKYNSAGQLKTLAMRGRDRHLWLQRRGAIDLFTPAIDSIDGPGESHR